MEEKKMYMTAEDAETREQLVFGRPYRSELYGCNGGTSRFENMTVETAQKLMSLGFLDPEDCQNFSPSAKEIVDFCDAEDRDIWRLHGYVVSPNRFDCRVTIEGCNSIAIPSAKRIIDFAYMFRHADEFYIDSYCYCWYD